MTLADKIAEARRLDAERASCERTIEQAQWCDNYRDAARARDRLAQIDAHARNHHAALWAVAEAAQAHVDSVFRRDEAKGIHVWQPEAGEVKP